MQDGALEVQDGPWKLPKAKLDGNLVANMTQVGPKRGQGGPRWPETGSQTYDHRIYSMIAARFGGHFGAILGYLGASGASLGVSEGVLGLACWAL